ncbi:hypothetical protein [Streptomyces sp. 15-116A]|uniref:hypothetical protein n=1 Tax=Streptomyces sp. 15-116A TaxID=2259035 RepID=UPI0028C3D9E0|nr:hypothetical protein [Streptomyces sp. 15-116A]
MQTDEPQLRDPALPTVRVEAAFTGTAEERARAHALFAKEGWRISAAQEEAYPDERGPDGAEPDDAVRSAVYTLRIPVPPDAGRRPEWWAVQEVEDRADAAQLDLQPGSGRHQRRQRRQQPHWLVCAPRRTDPGTWARWRFNLERRLGRYDTGVTLPGSFEEAERVAGPGCVRPPFPIPVGVHGTLPRIGAIESRERFMRGTALCWAAGVPGIPVVTGPWWAALLAIVMASLLTWGSTAIMPPLVRRPSGAPGDGDGDGRPWGAALLMGGTWFASTALLTWQAGAASALVFHLLMAGALFVTGGIRRLIRAGARRPLWVAVLVAVLPVLLPQLGGLSPAVFTFYGAVFHVRAEEIDVAQVWQFLAALHAAAISAGLTLLLLACWGYLRPFLQRRALRPLVPVAALTHALVLVLAWLTVLADPAGAAGAEAMRDWRSGRVPAPYFGAGPRPVCVRPIGPLDELPLYGHRLNPEQVYGSFGVTDGKVTLWDPRSGDAFPVPSDAVQVFFAGRAEPRARIPRTCSSLRW